MDASTAKGLLAILLWSLTVGFARSLAEQIGPINAGIGVYGLSSLVLVIHRVISRRPFRALWALPKPYFFGCGALFVAYTASLYAALGLAANRAQALAVGLINYLWPSLTILFSLVLLKKRKNWLLLPATCLALAGVYLAVLNDSPWNIHLLFGRATANPLPYFFALVAAVTWALYSNFVRLASSRQPDGAVVIFVIASAVVLLVIRLFIRTESQWTPRAFIEIVILGLATAVSYVFWDQSMRRGNMTLVTSVSYFTPLLSTIVAGAYLRVMPKPMLWVGCGLIIAGSYLSARSLE